MLYDPKWEKQAETKCDPRSLEGLIAWLEKQPASATYDYRESDMCLIAQWLKTVTPQHYALYSGEVDALFGGNGNAIVQMGNWTFGAALERARSFVK